MTARDMGYYGSGFVFTREPRWDGLAWMPSGVGLTGYRHKARAVWLLDAWTCRSRGEHWPFTDELAETVPMPPVAGRTEEVVRTFEEISVAVREEEFGEVTYGAGYLRLAAHLSTALGESTFFFAADDELTDMAAVATGGSLERFRVRFGVWAVEFRDGRFSATPRMSGEDEGIRFSDSVARAIAGIPGVTVTDPVDTSGGDPLYGAAVDLWPEAAGDPVATLGVGTWDPFEHLDRDFSVVFERKCPAAAVPTSAPAKQMPKKPWWKRWS